MYVYIINTIEKGIYATMGEQQGRLGSLGGTLGVATSLEGQFLIQTC